MKTILKNQKQRENKKQNNQQKEKQSKECASTRTQKVLQGLLTQQAPVETSDDSLLDLKAQESEIEAFYQKVAADEASNRRHALDLQQTPGLEHLTLEEALEKVDFMQRFAALVFQRHCREQFE